MLLLHSLFSMILVVNWSSNVAGKNFEGSKLRGVQSPKGKQFRRALPPKKKGGGGHHHSYYGCLSLSSEELAQSWTFSGSAPNCSYTHPGSGGQGSDESSEPDYDSTDKPYDDSVVDEPEYDSVDGDQEQNDDGDQEKEEGADDGGQEENNGGNGESDDYDVIVTNEDVANGTNYDVYEDFNVTKCETYVNLWIWDLALTCDNQTSFHNCNCTFAEELMASGLLTCNDYALCPKDCPICTTCMTMVGCLRPIPQAKAGDAIHTTIIISVIAGAVLLLILALALYHRRRQKSIQESELKESLMIGERAAEDFNPQKPKLGSWNTASGSDTRLNSATLAGAMGGIVKPPKEESDGDSDSDDSGDSGTVPTMAETTVTSPTYTWSIDHVADHDDDVVRVPTTIAETGDNEIDEPPVDRVAGTTDDVADEDDGLVQIPPALTESSDGELSAYI